MAFIPLFDQNPRIYLRYPWVTWGLIALNVYFFISQVSGSQLDQAAIVYGYGFIPSVFSGQDSLPPQLGAVPSVATLVTSLFLHGSIAHLIGNMLFLWVFGDNVEDAMGHGRFLLFYLVCGVIATLAHFATAPGSPVPVIGASGAISGVLGAYLLLHPGARVLVPIIIIPIFLPAWLLLIGWFGLQFLSATSPGAAYSNVAFWAHIGGFLAGMALVVPMRRKTVALFGRGRPPRGIRMKRPPRGGTGAGRRKGPWG